MNDHNEIYEFELHHYLWNILRKYDTIENFIKLFVDHNDTLIKSIDSCAHGNLLIFNVQLNAREFNKNILKYGYCDLRHGDKEKSENEIKLTYEHVTSTIQQD